MNPKADFVSDSRSNFPIFHKYEFGAFCYNTYGCKVLHANAYHNNDGPEELAPPPPSMEKRLRYMTAGFNPGVPPFPDPVRVTWKSLDGVAHEAVLDLDEIFKGHRLLYKTPEDQISVARTPHILVEINDRTINVYMRTLITLKDRTERKFDDDLILAYTHTY
jgi:hypothetical protein